MSAAPIEAKVKTATAAATLVALAVGLLQQYVFKSGPVPEFVVAFVESAIGSLVTGVVTFVVGWCTKHTRRFLHVEHDNT